MNQNNSSTASASQDGAARTRISRSERRARPSSLCLSCFDDMRRISGEANCTKSFGNAVLALFRSSAMDNRRASSSVLQPLMCPPSRDNHLFNRHHTVKVCHEAVVSDTANVGVVRPPATLDLVGHRLISPDQRTDLGERAVLTASNKVTSLRDHSASKDGRLGVVDPLDSRTCAGHSQPTFGVGSEQKPVLTYGAVPLTPIRDLLSTCGVKPAHAAGSSRWQRPVSGRCRNVHARLGHHRAARAEVAVSPREPVH